MHCNSYNSFVLSEQLSKCEQVTTHTTAGQVMHVMLARQNQVYVSQDRDCGCPGEYMCCATCLSDAPEVGCILLRNHAEVLLRQGLLQAPGDQSLCACVPPSKHQK